MLLYQGAFNLHSNYANQYNLTKNQYFKQHQQIYLFKYII